MKYFSEILKELEDDNLAMFLGAGFSMSAGYVSWKDLLRKLAKEINLDIDKETDLVAVAQYHCNFKLNNRSSLNKCIVENFSSQCSITENHRILARLPIKEFWTTNYDRLIEKSLEDAKKIPDVKYAVDQLTFTKRKRDCIVYKMHGDVENPNNAIITKDDYEKYYKTHEPFITALSGSLVSKTFVFIGFSFTDPNLDYVLSRIRVNYSNNQRDHYCFLRIVQEKDYKPDEKYKYEYDKCKQELFIKDLKRFAIQVIKINEYSEITDYLHKLSTLYKRKTIFISGAAHEYGGIKNEDAQDFIHNLSKQIIKKDYKIVSGFGLGVGSAVITGALRELYLHTNHPEIDRVILRPFPQGMTDATKQEFWTKYRKNMCEYAGVAIFIFGNKLDKGKTVYSSGMREEFDIAKKKGLFLIPVGVTGFMSKELYDEVSKDLDSYGYKTDSLKENFKKLGKNNVDDSLIDIIMNILAEIIE